MILLYRSEIQCAGSYQTVSQHTACGLILFLIKQYELHVFINFVIVRDD